MSRFIGAISFLFLVCLVASASTPPNFDRALEIQFNLARESPGDADIQNDLGNLLVLVDRLEEAEGAYQRALELDETKISARFNLALLLQHRGKTISALRHFRGVIDRDPDHAWANYQAGILYQKLGMNGRAVKSYSHAIRLDRTLVDPKVNPHIIQNSLYSKAMLEAYHKGVFQSSPPRTYDDPFRIAGLLVPEIKQDPAPPDVVQAAATETLTDTSLTETAEPSGSGAGNESEVEVAPSEERSQDDRVLTVESLDDAGPSSQASPTGASSAGQSGSNRGGQRATTRGGSTGSRGTSVPAIRLPNPPSQQNPTTRGGRTGVRSTGQLEIDLVPVRAS